MNTVEVHWVVPNGYLIHTMRGLYLWEHHGEILLIGKADYQTTWERWKCDSKDGVVEWAHEQNIRKVRTLLGELRVPRLTSKLLADVENVLIMGTQARGNVN